MHNKILATTLIFLGVTNVVFATHTPVIESSIITANGFYVAADIGAANLMTKESHSVAPESHQLGSLGAVGGAFVGYDYGLYNRLRLAIEGFVEVANQDPSISHSPNTYKMEQDYNLGLRLLPEYVFTPFTVGHVVLGYVNRRFHINDNGVYGTVNSTFHQGGFQTGLGLTTTIQNNFLFRIDALYDMYPSTTKTGVGLTAPTQSYTNRFSQLAGELALIYKFC